MKDYPKPIKRLMRQYLTEAYNSRDGRSFRRVEPPNMRRMIALFTSGLTAPPFLNTYIP